MENITIRKSMKAGAAIGSLVFLAVGIMPGFYFGSSATLILLSKLSGGPVEPTLFVRAAVVMGIVVGIACAATVSVVVGGLIGTAVGAVLSPKKAAVEAKAPVKL